MELSAIDVLGCPSCHQALALVDAQCVDTAVVSGALRCDRCEKAFSIAEGIPTLVEPHTLADQLAQVGSADVPFAERYDRANKVWLLQRGLFSILWEDRVRRLIVSKLALAPGARLLETVVGTASNLKVLAKTGHQSVEMHGTDLSGAMLQVARRKMASAGRVVNFTQANAEYLPYRDDSFDAVLHVGAINQLGDKTRALAEMCRVARPGARIVISDEGLHPEKARTLHGRWILRHEVFRAEPPLALLPEQIREVKVSWVLQRAFWVVECVKAS